MSAGGRSRRPLDRPMAHELGHGLGIGKHGRVQSLTRDGVITSDGRDGLLIDQKALDMINSPSRK
jgi:hypothetical protein